MKRALILALIFTLLATTLVSALTIDMKENFNQEETLTARIAGDFIRPPLQNNVYLYRGHVRSAINAELSRVDNDYYVCLPLLGKAANNYTLVIEDVEYRKASQTITEDLEKNFTITENMTDFLVDKCFLNTKGDFDLELENLEDEKITVKLNISTIEGQEGEIFNYAEDTEHELTLDPGKTKINFDVGIFEESAIKIIQLRTDKSSYQIPVSIFPDETIREGGEHFAFKVQPEEMNIKMNTSSELTRLVSILNTGSGTLTNVRMELSESLKTYLRISEESFGKITPGLATTFNLTIFSGGEKTISGDLYIQTDQGLANRMKVNIQTIEGYEGKQVTEHQLEGKCADRGGEVCPEKTVCSNVEEAFHADDGLCCIGECLKDERSSTGKIVGWLIVVAIIAGGAWFFLTKYKGKKQPVNLVKIAQGKRSQLKRN